MSSSKPRKAPQVFVFEDPEKKYLQKEVGKQQVCSMFLHSEVDNGKEVNKKGKRKQ